MNDDFCFRFLTPDSVLDALESVGVLADTGLTALNSYENRVYQFVDRDGLRKVVKFYRPQRWDQAQLEEEHAFALALADAEIPVVAPLRLQGQTLHYHDPFYFAVYPSVGGYPFERDDFDQLERIGQWFGRMHRLGARSCFQARLSLTPEMFERDLVILKNDAQIPSYIHLSYWTTIEDLRSQLAEYWPLLERSTMIRLHGDAHAGNLLLRDEKLAIVDLDDACNGPAIQDLWMFLNGDRVEQTAQLDALLSGYEEFFSFDHRQLALIETLRTMRIVHHSAWLTQRWQDPAFPMHFPWFNTEHYWEQQVLHIREQLALLQEPPLTLMPN